MPHQLNWILAEEAVHPRNEQVMALAEKSIRIGWTYADAFKNVRKRLHFPDRDYLFATKDYPSALEYVRQCRKFAEFFDVARAIVSHGEDYLKVARLNEQGRPTSFTDEIKVSYIKFDNRSRILAFSAHPQAMAVYGGDVGLDEFAKHQNAQVLWETAQGRVAWGYDLAVWSAHDGQDTLFYQFAQAARASLAQASPPASSPSAPPGEGSSEFKVQSSKFKVQGSPSVPLPRSSTLDFPSSPWNLYYRVTMPDALDLGLLDFINCRNGTRLTPERFLADCRARAGLEHVFQQSYLCNPAPAGLQIVDWSAIERCRSEYDIERAHLEHDQIIKQFGEFRPEPQSGRQRPILAFLREAFPSYFKTRASYRLGFDVAASGQGDLAAIYVDEAKGPELWLRALFTCRTEDWHFLKSVLHAFLNQHPWIQAVGDESGLGRQICWETSKAFPGRFSSVNFSSKKHDMGFSLMNQLSVAEKRFPRNQQDIASDYFALRKSFSRNRWIFTEGRNTLNPASHCDIAWAGALATHAHTNHSDGIIASILMEDGTLRHYGAG
jgi:phage FluMu gp28-like protein